MKAVDCSLWEFDSELKDDSEILCPECEEYSNLSEWYKGKICCGVCGSHVVMICPECSECIDNVWHEPIKVK